MSRGEPLTDHDRDPWLTLIREKAVELMSEEEVPSTATGSPPKIVVIACSALKRIYRDVIRGHHPSTISRSASIRTYFVFIDGPREVLLKRMSGRKGHFMKVGMLDSQLDTLERPNEGDEERIVVVSLEASVEEQVRRAIEELNEAGLKY